MKRFLTVILFLFVSVSFLNAQWASAGKDQSIEELKKQDIERAIKYDRLKNSGVASPIRQALPQQALSVDTDDDGMPDSWELANGLDSNNPDDAWFDPDGDKVVNLFEYQLGGAPNNSLKPLVVTVAPSGADYAYISTAIDSVAPGTVIRVAGGLYYLNYTTFSSKIVMIQGGWSSDFSKRDLELYPTTFDGRMQDEILYFSIGSGKSVIILDGINFIKGNGYFGAVNLLAEGSVLMKTSIFNCSITESESAYCDYGGVLKMNNWDSSESDRTIANTVIAGNGASGIYSQITDYTTAHWRIINTTISQNLNGGGHNGYGIEALTFDYRGLTAHIYNSILWGNEQDDISIRRNITFKVDHSDIGNVYVYLGAVYLPSAEVMNINPLFINPANDDFHLGVSSPLIDEGTNQGIPLIDFEGDPRITDGDVDGTATVDMGADEYAPQYTLTIAAGTGGTTNPAPSSYIYYIGEKVQIKAVPNSGYQFSGWSGAVTGTTNSITVTMDADKSVTASFTEIPKPPEEKKKGGCFIATAAYGSPLDPHVQILRQFRDKHLMTNRIGRSMVDLYYKYSPPIADYISKHKFLKPVVRAMLLPFITLSYLIVH
jgi:uncharacterized repeat protein (TIGR02543 family)